MSFDSVKANNFLRNKDLKVVELVSQSNQLKYVSKYEGIRRSISSLLNAASFAYDDVHFFGSRIIGLATNASDLDVFIDTGGSYYKTYNVSREHDVKYQKLVRAIENGGDFTIQNKILKTAVPIIEVVHRSSGMKCDINITNGLSVENSKLLAHLFEIQPEAVALYHFIKSWMSDQGFDGLKGYTVCLLVLFYLQSKNLMPSVEEVQKGLSKVLINGWEVQFAPYRSLASYNVPRMTKYTNHVQGFFQFYKDFDYGSLVMSTYHGKSINVIVYKRQFLKFLLKGIYIAGPVNRGKNCGIVDYAIKPNFINLCKASSDFFSSAIL